ncbi:MAG: chemotaxis protein CheB [Eubacteriales bacterium]
MIIHKKNAAEPESNSPGISTIAVPDGSGVENIEEKPEKEEHPKSPRQFPVVGIGASAGGLAAFEAFFNGLPSDRDLEMSFVLIQHLAPDHKSILTDIIRRYTKMQVFEVEDGMAVRPNCAYIIPPNRDMAFLNGTLQLFEPVAPRGQHMPIDFFFRSLANDQHERAICIILSGTGSDGTLGLRAIKGEGGMAIAQSLESAEYDGMPRSAIETGLVDYELPPVEMGKKVMAYVSHAFPRLQKSDSILLSKTENTLKKVFILLRSQTGHDFSKYKPSTINRRIERRLAIQQIKTMDEYVKFLQQTPTEVNALYHDLLIGVTSFFRDKAAFDKLQKDVIPLLFTGKTSASTLRVWCVGCSTGEEAYSIAILLQEEQERRKKSCNIQLFATDIDNYAITIARTGIYPAGIAADISPERLSRFFSAESSGNSFRINKNIRDMLIFSEQSIIKDPPFSRIDLICCRNLLIYLNSELQKKIIPLFHYSLNPDGILFLGSSETIGNFESLFSTVDRKLKIYQSKDDLPGKKRATLTEIIPPLSDNTITAQRTSGVTAAASTKQPLREIAEQTILRESELSGVLVNELGDILYLHGRTGLFLEPAPGEAGTMNIHKMAREGLQRELTQSLHKSVITKEIIRLHGISIKPDGHFIKINVTVRPTISITLTKSTKPLYMIIFEKINEPDTDKKEEPVQTLDPARAITEHVEDLKKELWIKEEYLQSANEELETSNEELKATNEEMQSVNEELQSTNEELETSKEELQSINEELSTVNTELQVRVHDLSQISNDMNNLLAGTNIATVFLDYQMKIMRFTPAATQIINLIIADVGRPVSHIASNLVGYNQLTADVQIVLDTLIPREVQVQTKEGKWFNMIIQPYRTVDNVIEGAVITFVDITDVKLARDQLDISETRYRTLFETAQEGILILHGDTGKIQNVNPYLSEILGYSENQFLEKAIWDIGFFKDIVANKDAFKEMQRKNLRYEDLSLETSKGQKIDVEFISNVFSIDRQKYIQCNIRVVKGTQIS